MEYNLFKQPMYKPYAIKNRTIEKIIFYSHEAKKIICEHERGYLEDTKYQKLNKELEKCSYDYRTKPKLTHNKSFFTANTLYVCVEHLKQFTNFEFIGETLHSHNEEEENYINLIKLGDMQCYCGRILRTVKKEKGLMLDKALDLTTDKNQRIELYFILRNEEKRKKLYSILKEYEEK